MMPGKLYIKIFLSFLLILVVTEILVFGLFILASGRTLRGKFTQYTGAKVLLARELFEEKIKSQPGVPLTRNAPLKDFMTRFGGTFGAKLWLAAADGSPLIKSFPGDIPDIEEKIDEKRMRDFGEFKLYYSFRKHFESFAVIPLTYPEGKSGYLYVFFEEKGPSHSDHGFGLGLLGIGIVVALLTIPISRFITIRVKKLRTSAIKIAEGDLSHRAMIKGKDEIGELGRAFNRMADKLERMIRGNQELTANISHELRTPLARIRIAEELLREKLARKDIKNLERYLEDIREDIEALDHLIGRILDLSRLDLKDSPPKKEAFDPEEMVKALLDRLSPATQERGCRFTPYSNLIRDLSGIGRISVPHFRISWTMP
ncbi:MAG: HAMP domain-containing histidine kinase [Deltaproteobacteria bacterium]|nr:HAMP domain-containing histidine kinase [Deltaproteobacteria bacterium]